MKNTERWNSFFAVEKNIAYKSHMLTTKELSKLYWTAASVKCGASLSFGALIRKQLKFFAWKIWFLQGMALAVLCTLFLYLYKESTLDQFAATLPKFLCCSSGIIVMSAIPLLRRSFRCRMMELEQATRFSVSGSLAAQLLFIGIGDLGMLAALTVIVWQYTLTESVIFISLVIPFLTTTVTCLMLWIRTSPSAFERRAILLCIVTPLLMNHLIDWYMDSSLNGKLWCWYLYALLCLGALCHEYRKLRIANYREYTL